MKHLTETEINELLDNALSMSAASAKRSHLADCPECSKAFKTHERLRAALSTTPSFEPSAKFRAKVLESVEQEQAVNPLQRFLDLVQDWAVPAAMSTVAASLLVLSPFEYSTGDTTQSIDTHSVLFSGLQTSDNDTDLFSTADFLSGLGGE